MTDHEKNLRSGLTPVESQMSMFYGQTTRKAAIDTAKPGDYGSDPIGEDENGVFRWRMVPSGDIVDDQERKRRIKSRST